MLGQIMDFCKPLSLSGPYRYNPIRALPPRVLAAPCFQRLLSGDLLLTEDEEVSFRACLQNLESLFPQVTCGFMERGFFVGNGFKIDTIWSHTPHCPDIFVVTGPGDVGYFGVGYKYGKSGEEALFDPLTEIALPYLN